MLAHYVTFLYPGSFVSETSIKQIKSRKDKLDVPKEAFAYYFWDREEEGRDDDILKGKQKNISRRYYPEASLYDKETVKKIEGENSILYRNMINNNYNRVIKTRCGNWQPFNEGKDKII